MSTATGRLPLRRAWWSVVLIPVGLGVAFLLGESVPGFTGSGWTHNGDLPSGLVFALAAVAVLLVGLPAFSATWYGSLALRMGHRGGLVPLLIGAAALVYLGVTTIGGITGAT